MVSVRRFFISVWWCDYIKKQPPVVPRNQRLCPHKEGNYLSVKPA